MFRLVLALLVSMLALLACDDDDPAQPVEENSGYLPLTTPTAVVSNLELAWNDFEGGRIDELLDPNFTFHPTAGDVGSGLPESWDRATELQATTSLFGSGNGRVVASSSGPVVLSARIDILFDDVEWDAFSPPTAPEETWFRTTAPYTFTIEMEPDNTYIAMPGASAEFVVREDDAGTWRLVEWHDHASTLASGSHSSVDATTWGQIKDLYRELPYPSRSDVLVALRDAYNQRDAGAIDALLDENFTFFVAPGDVGAGLPEQWARADEVQITTRWFTSNQQPQPPTDPVCTSMLFNIQFDPNTITWIEVIPEDFPGETWYTTTVFYSFTVEIEPDNTYISVPGAKSQFTVRDVGDEEHPSWRLVEWRDLASTGYRAGADATSESTWSSVKGLYR